MNDPSLQDSGVEYAAVSDVGLRRTNNQDSYAVEIAATAEKRLSRGHLFLVADGMGAHAAGELASKLAADTIALAYAKREDLDPAQALRGAIEEANHVIHERGTANAEFHGMGTTCSTLLLLPEGALVGHVGDSRVYRMRDKRLEQLTFDHSLVWELKFSGSAHDKDPPPFVPKNIITRSLGPSADVAVDLEGPFSVQVGDTFLVCSDGLSGQVDDQEIGVILRALPPGEAAQTLVDLANLRGGPDNSTVIIARVKGGDLVTSAVAGRAPSRGPAPQGAGPPAHAPDWWALVAAVLAAAMAVAGAAAFRLGVHPGAGIAAFLVACGLAVVAVGRFWIGASSRAADDSGAPEAARVDRHGRGPYTVTECTPSQQFTDMLGSVLDQLKEAAVADEWQVDWEGFEARRDAIAESVRRSDFLSAVRDSCQAISALMRELRNQPPGAH